MRARASSLGESKSQKLRTKSQTCFFANVAMPPSGANGVIPGSMHRVQMGAVLTTLKSVWLICVPILGFPGQKLTIHPPPLCGIFGVTVEPNPRFVTYVFNKSFVFVK